MFTGYNKERVEDLRGAINTTAQNAAEGIVEKLGSGIITPISNAWYAPEAVTFFENFAEVVAKSGTNIHTVFEEFKKYVEEAGKNWAENTGGEIPVLPAIDDITLTLDVSSVKEKAANGDVGVFSNEAMTVVNSLNAVQEDIKDQLESLAAQLSADTAFIGGSQAESIQNCFVAVSGEVHKIFNYLTEGEDSLRGALTKSVEKYGDVSEGISTAFGTSQING